MSLFGKFLQTAILVIAAINILADEQKICIPRKYKAESIVCVCNSTYCDTAPSIETPPQGRFAVVTSSQSGERFKVTVGEFTKRRLIELPKLSLRISRNVEYQSIFGFGGAFTDSAGINILSLSEETQDNLFRSYFLKEGGIEYTYGRVPIGGTDFSTRGYTYQDNVEDASLKHFALAGEDYQYKIPLIKRAADYIGKPLQLIATCWTPPTWMKTNHNFYGFGTLKPEFYKAYANYYVKFLDEYKYNGVEFWSITTGNEPINGLLIWNKINSLGWTPLSQRQWIGEYLGPMINNSSHKQINILAIDDQRIVLPGWLEVVMEDSNARKYIKGVGVHWYLDFIVPTVVLERTHDKFPNLFLINTEASVGDRPWDFVKVILGSWDRAENYAQHMIEDFNNWISGWLDWNLALNEEGGPNWVDNRVDAPIIVNKTADEFYKQPMFYILGHFSKFITEKSVRIQVDGLITTTIISVLAVKRPDNSVAVVLLNRKPITVPVVIEDSVQGRATINLPAKSISTVIYS